MKIYIASGLPNFEKAKGLASLFKSLNYEITYEWWRHNGVQNLSKHWTESKARMEVMASFEIQGVLNADVIVVVLPGGRGTHVEMGAALGFGKEVILFSSEAELGDGRGQHCAFYHHLRVTWASQLQSVLELLKVKDLELQRQRAEAEAIARRLGEPS